MSDLDKQYINYNLSLVDPQNIAIETPNSIKEDIDISLYALDENKPSNGGTLPIDWFSQLGFAKEYPMEPIDSKFKTHIVREDGDVAPSPTLLQKLSGNIANEKMKDFEITDDNLGKGNTVEIQNANFGSLNRSKFLDLENGKYTGFTLRDDNLGKNEDFAEIEIQNSEDDSKDDSVKIEMGEGEPEVKGNNTIVLSPFMSENITISKTPYSTEELTYNQVISQLNIKGDSSNLGSIHVYPSNPSDEGGILSKYIIPFEFNPNITEGGRGAKYEASSLLSRVGDIQSYIKTDAMSVQITTHYQVLTNSKAVNDKITKVGDHAAIGSWMDPFHLRNIQSIEMAYRGLVFPQLARNGSSFFRPPLIKVVFGKDNETVTDTVPFNNLLTYPYKMVNGTKIYHKSFIVTKVDIKKDWENMPIILNDENNGILDLQGFDVSLDLMEVDPMYIGVLPSFEDYYSIAKNVDKVAT